MSVMSSPIQTKRISSLLRFGLSADNSLLAALTADNDIEQGRSRCRQVPRQVTKAHFSYVCPEPVTSPKLVHVTESVAKLVGIDPVDLDDDTLLASAFSGNVLLPGLDCGYATVYGGHSFEQWLGQLGDGRAISLGEVMSPVGNEHLELQLKGAGKTTFSRGFDGRAVLRSSIREYLASEAMYGLGVRTTRSLALVTADDKVKRKWYGDDSSERSSPAGPYLPGKIIEENVAVVCRVSSSFFRFGHIEYFAKRKEEVLLVHLVNHILEREYPHILNTEGCCKTGISYKPEIYISLFREISRRSMILVVEWLRVGFCQGNMNSDNSHVAGLTLDYGPFGWMERFSPQFQPFAGDATLKQYSFSQQASAMNRNLETLGGCFGEVLRAVCNQNSSIYTAVDAINYADEINDIVKREIYPQYQRHFENMIQNKLGLSYFDESVMKLWQRLNWLMEISGTDFTMLFRCLAEVISTSSRGDDAVHIIKGAFYDECTLDERVNDRTDSLVHSCGWTRNVVIEGHDEIRALWCRWVDDYADCCQRDKSYKTAQERASRMNQCNPKYVLRNWMATLSYQHADEGDYSLVKELSELLKHPYEEGSEDMQNKWYRKTPSWAVDKPGISFMS